MPPTIAIMHYLHSSLSPSQPYDFGLHMKNSYPFCQPLVFFPPPGRDVGQPRGVQPHPEPSGRQSGREDQEAQNQQNLALEPHQPLGRKHAQPTGREETKILEFVAEDGTTKKNSNLLVFGGLSKTNHENWKISLGNVIALCLSLIESFHVFFWRGNVGVITSVGGIVHCQLRF